MEGFVFGISLIGGGIFFGPGPWWLLVASVAFMASMAPIRFGAGMLVPLRGAARRCCLQGAAAAEVLLSQGAASGLLEHAPVCVYALECCC